MEGENRHLDGKSEKKGGEQPAAGNRGESRMQQSGQGKGVDTALTAVDQVEADYCQEHEERADQGIEEELDR